MKIQPARRLRGVVSSLPGDKSISHRAATIAALARGRCVISNYSTSADCAATLRCLEQLGVHVERDENTVHLEGVGHGRGAGREDDAPTFSPSTSPLDCGNSGSTMRMLAGVLAAQPFTSTLTGDDSLSKRPMQRIIEPLARMGARIASEEGHAPLGVEGRRPLAPLHYEMPVASAQVKSCILLAGLGARGRTTVVESRTPTRDHTERMLRWLGVAVETSEAVRTDGSLSLAVSIEGLESFEAHDIDVPGDISAASFLVAAAALLPGSQLTLDGIGLNPTRTQILETLRHLGVDARTSEEREQCNEPVGRGGEAAHVLRGARIAQLIDELPVLAVVGTQVEGGLEIRDAKELRIKESDRISATVENLRAMGARVEEYEDGLKVEGRTQLRGARLDSYGDHRIAMAFAVAALLAEGETEISGAQECVGVSFPEFFNVLESLAER